MHLTTWHYIGMTLLGLDIICSILYYYHATVKIYNYYEKNTYLYLGHLWIYKKNGQWYLKIPKKMIEESFTTKYKIISQTLVHKLKKGEKVYINFANRYHTQAKIDVEITVENYITTSQRL